MTISGLTLRNGNGGPGAGGAIASWHSLALESVVVQDNRAQRGGGVALLAQYTGQSLTITQSEFVGNRTAEVNIGEGVNGGAVIVGDYCAFPNPIDIPVTISNSTFHGNRVVPTTINGAGAALTLESMTNATITDSRIYDNHVEVNGRAGAVRFTGKALRFVRTEIAENSAPGNGAFQFSNIDPLRQGPADVATVTFVNSTVAANATTNGGSSALVNGNVAVELVNSTYANNVPNPGGGGSAGMFFSNPCRTRRPR